MNTSVRMQGHTGSALPDVSAKGYAWLSAIGGFLLLAVGIALDSSVVAIFGFFPFTLGLLYLNGMFWGKKFDENPNLVQYHNYKFWL